MITNAQLVKQLAEVSPGTKLTNMTVDQRLSLLNSVIAAERLSLDLVLAQRENDDALTYGKYAERQLAVNEGFLRLAQAEAAKP